MEAVSIIKPVGNPVPAGCFTGIIYKVTNKINGKVYIGQSVEVLIQRKCRHTNDAKNGNGYYLHRALRKYGVDNFKWEVIQICKDIDELNQQEAYFIALYDSMNTGYNLTSGGENYIRSEKTKDILRQINLGKKLSEESKEKMRQSHLGKKLSEETKQKIRQTNLGKKHTPESIKKMSGENHPFFGKHLSVQRKEKLRQINLNRSEETKQKMIDNHADFSGRNNPMYGKRGMDAPNYGKRGTETSMYGRKHSKETKKKMRIAQQKRRARERTCCE